MNKDLFGNEIDIEKEAKPFLGHYQKWKRDNKYGASLDEKRCGNCVNARRVKSNVKTYYKCVLMGISNSEASDIRLKNVCDNFIQGD